MILCFFALRGTQLLLGSLAAKTRNNSNEKSEQLLTMDILVLATKKNAAKCDTSCELQNPVNHEFLNASGAPENQEHARSRVGTNNHRSVSL